MRLFDLDCGAVVLRSLLELTGGTSGNREQIVSDGLPPLGHRRFREHLVEMGLGGLQIPDEQVSLT